MGEERQTHRQAGIERQREKKRVNRERVGGDRQTEEET